MAPAVMGFCSLSHPRHKLELKNYLKPFTCDGCKETGFGSRYRCEKCDFDLHEACMFPQTSPSSHEFFPHSTFQFFRTPTPSCHPHCRKICDACIRPINGFVYHCEEDDLDLHPCCRNLQKKYLIDDMEFKLHRKVRDKCKWCNKKRLTDNRRDENGWSYISRCGEYHFHVACMTEMFMEEWNKRGDRVGNNSTGNGNDESLSLALGKVNLHAIEARGRWRGGGVNKYWKILRIFFETIASILLGDPTFTIASLVIDLIA